MKNLFCNKQTGTKPNRDNIRTKCPYCENVYEWKRGLRKHLKKYHIQEQKEGKQWE